MTVFRACVIAAAVACGLGAVGVARAQSMSADTLFKDMQNESSAWSVTTKQTSLSANVMGTSDLDSKKQLANALGAIDMSNRVTQAAIDFNPMTGQPSSILCSAQQNGKLAVEARSQQQMDGNRLMASYASTRVGSRAQADTDRLTLHRGTYCTVSESKSGLCALTANGMQGWDVNYQGAFGQDTLAPEGEVAGYAYVSMLSDTRAEVKTDCSSTACASAQASQLAASAASSMVANSLVGQITERRQPILTGQ